MIISIGRLSINLDNVDYWETVCDPLENKYKIIFYFSERTVTNTFERADDFYAIEEILNKIKRIQ